MPNLSAHTNIAILATKHLGDKCLDLDLKYFVLGATAPDIRIITKFPRETYHFAQLDFSEIGTGKGSLLKTHPDLLPNSITHNPTRAFIAGYISHLILDESWITEMYRPYFGNNRVFMNPVYGKVLDRAFQLELDLISRNDSDLVLSLLSQSTETVDVNFIPPKTQITWQKWVREHLKQDFTWERLRHMARRISRGVDDHPAHQIADQFLNDMPESIERMHDYVSYKDLTDFKDRAIDRLANEVGDYV